MRIVMIASGEFAVPTLRSLCADRGHDITAVLTQPDRPAGRGRKLQPTPVRLQAVDLGLSVHPVGDVNHPSVIECVRQTASQVGLVIAFGQKLGAELLASFPSGCINLHASLLPKYRGAAPYQWALINGEPETGVTVFRITDRMDAGPILTQRSTVVRPAETADELHDRLAQIGADAVGAALALWGDGDEPAGRDQDEAQATKAPKLSKQNEIVDFCKSAAEIAHAICGLWSWPGATATYYSHSTGRKEWVTFARARVAETAIACGETPGTINTFLHVATGRGWLEILEVKPQGGRVMSWSDFVNGRHVTAGDWFSVGAAQG